jgi:hypothetical protein
MQAVLDDPVGEMSLHVLLQKRDVCGQLKNLTNVVMSLLLTEMEAKAKGRLFEYFFNLPARTKQNSPFNSLLDPSILTVRLAINRIIIAHLIIL